MWLTAGGCKLSSVSYMLEAVLKKSPAAGCVVLTENLRTGVVKKSCLLNVFSLYLHFSINSTCKKLTSLQFSIYSRDSAGSSAANRKCQSQAGQQNHQHAVWFCVYIVLFCVTHLNHIRFPKTSVHFIVHQTTGEIRPEHHRIWRDPIFLTRSKKEKKE